MQRKHITGFICLAVALVVMVITGRNFLSLKDLGTIVPGPGVTEQKMLSAYFDGIEGTNMDTEVYIMEGSSPGGKMLILGGTHGNEPSGYLSAIAFIENATVESGTVYVIPYTNHSGMTHNDPQEASPQYIHIPTDNGVRTFRYGSRASNPVDQWPDPDVYVHAASGQQLSGSETRNINRAYPGRPDGTPTEQAAYAIAELVRNEDVNLTFDLHEASPEYPVINATVSHEKGMSVAAEGVMELQLKGIAMSLEPSPTNLHGLTHRELGDYTDTIPLLMESANASQGRLRGATNEALALTGIDKAYVKSEALGFLYVPYDEKGHPIEERVGRHLQGIIEYTKAYSAQYADAPVTFIGVPTYDDLFLSADEADLGGVQLGRYLH
ncbi:succinylglutamate desuccinylase/aspartoacylase family protein [Fusibacter paucivorans]|uniref:Succinylglutamate desuccinylase/aspartoacylase family protein n=1 Tax=Fusibacter paucivorans TaxID=76009 RepID=A0ABS5PJF5_9FIRM|nr:succinylglutamate desuccinylase/aspartoacylase family protein [Fusibacter paucivorans]MBS7525178.1 succinylglutamate desuccinylase/aspartoacylase family protein [Fusibacter paucivorans]